MYVQRQLKSFCMDKRILMDYVVNESAGVCRATHHSTLLNQAGRTEAETTLLTIYWELFSPCQTEPMLIQK